MIASVVRCFCSYAVARSRQSAAFCGCWLTLCSRFEIDGPLLLFELKKFCSALEMPLEPEPTPRSANVAAKQIARKT